MNNYEQIQSDLISSIVALRKSKKISQIELSELSGVKQPIIARLEKRRTDPQLSTIIKLLDSMGTELTIKDKDVLNNLDFNDKKGGVYNE